MVFGFCFVRNSPLSSLKREEVICKIRKPISNLYTNTYHQIIRSFPLCYLIWLFTFYYLLISLYLIIIQSNLKITNYKLLRNEMGAGWDYHLMLSRIHCLIYSQTNPANQNCRQF